MRPRILLAAALGWLAASASSAGAYTVTTLGNAGGDPGDLCEEIGGTACQPRLEVSGLLEGDALNLEWFMDGTDFDGGDGIPDMPTLSAGARMTLTSLTPDSLVLDIVLHNTTQLSANHPSVAASLSAPIVSFGLELDGFSSGILSVAGASLDTFATGNIAGGLTSDFCASTKLSCNSGQASFGIGIGDSDAFQFALAGTFDPIAGVTLRNFGIKWQTNYETLVTPDNPVVVASGNSSFELPSLSATLIVPEPSTALLLACGLAALAAGKRQR